MSETYPCIEDMNEDSVKEAYRWLLKKNVIIYKTKDIQDTWCHKRMFYIRGIRWKLVFYLRAFNDSRYNIPL